MTHIFLHNDPKAGVFGRGGFLLAEAAMTVAIISILGATLIPKLTQKYEMALIEKTAAEVRSIQAAAKNYRVATGNWPPDIATMRDLGYLPVGWDARTPWGDAYAVLPGSASLDVSVRMPSKYRSAMKSFLPLTMVSGDVATSTVTVPGGEVMVDGLLGGSGIFTGDITIDKVSPALKLKDEGSGLLYRIINGASHLQFLNDASTATVDVDQAGTVTALSDVVSGGSVYAKRYIDADNTSFYMDPNGTSSMSAVVVGTVSGSTAASGTLALNGTSSATSGSIILNANGGSVGIGTAAPAYTLDVNGQIRTSGGIVFSDGTSMTTAVTGYWTKNGDDITNNNSGNVYIATGSSLVIGQSTAPADKLDINGSINLGTTHPALKIRNVQRLMSSGINSVFVGDAGNTTTTLDGVTAIGDTIAQSIVSGSRVTAVGRGSGFTFSSGTDVTLLGANTAASAGLSNATAIGAQAMATGSNAVIVGRSSECVVIGATAQAPAWSQLFIKGNDALASSFALVTQDSDGASLLAIRNDGAVQLKGGVGLVRQSMMSAGSGYAYWGDLKFRVDVLNNLVAGPGAMAKNVASQENIALGRNSLYWWTGSTYTVSGNVGIGSGALYSATPQTAAATDTVAIGHNAAALERGVGNSVFLGAGADDGEGFGRVALAIGKGALANTHYMSNGSIGPGTASSYNGFALGASSNANNGGTMIGINANKLARGGVFALGNNTIFGTGAGGATIIGNGLTVDGSDAFLMGGKTASGSYAIAVGYNSVASGNYSAALSAATASADYSSAIGPGTSASGDHSIAVGYGANASGSYSAAIGTGVSVASSNAIVIGKITDTVVFGHTATDPDPDPNIRLLFKGSDSTSTTKYVFAARNNVPNIAIAIRNDGKGIMPLSASIGAADPGANTRCLIQGADNSNSKYALFVQNSAGTTLFTVRNDGAVTVSGTGKITASTVNATTFTSSDVRLKRDFSRIHTPLEKVLSLEGYTYVYRTDEFPDKNLVRGRQIGLVAQDLEKVLPELVGLDSDGFKSVNYAGMVPVLVEALKDLNAKVSQISAVAVDVTAHDGRGTTYDFKSQNGLEKLFSVNVSKAPDLKAAGYLSAKDIYLSDKNSWMSEAASLRMIQPIEVYGAGVTTGFQDIDMPASLPATAKVVALEVSYTGGCSLKVQGVNGSIMTLDKGIGFIPMNPDRIMTFSVDGEDDCFEQIRVVGYH